MPTATTSSSTGSRVLQKHKSRESISSQQLVSRWQDGVEPVPPPVSFPSSSPKLPDSPNMSNSSPNGRPIAPATASGVDSAPAPKRASASSGMSSKIKRFPTLLHRRNSRSKDETIATHKNSRSTSMSEARLKEEMQNGGGAGGTGKMPSTPGAHTRSISLAAAPSSLPRPVTSPSREPGLPSSATAPNLAGLGKPAAAATPGSQSRSPSLSISTSGASAAAAVAAVASSPSPKRVPPPGAEGSGIPRLAKTSLLPRPEDSVQQASGETSNAGITDGAGIQPASVEAPAARELDGPGSTAGSGVENGHVGLNAQDAEAAKLRDLTAAQPANGDVAPVSASPAIGDSSIIENSRADETLDVSSEHLSRTSSGSRIPQGIARASARSAAAQGAVSPDKTVPAMWRSNSYEGSAQAYLANSPSMRDSIASSISSQGSAVAERQPERQPNESAHQAQSRNFSHDTTSSQPTYSKATYFGIEGLKALEADLPTQQNTAVVSRIRMIRQLVVLRGESVLDGSDLAEIVWAEGTDAHLSQEEEFARARNGKAAEGLNSLPTVSMPEEPQKSQSTVQPPTPKKQNMFDRVTARFGAGHKGSSHQQGRVDVSGQSAGETGSALSTSPPRAMPENAGNSPSSAQPTLDDPTKAKGPVFGTSLQNTPPLAMAISIIGGQRHQLPILVFSLVEAIFKRGLDTSGIFRFNGNADAVQRLMDQYNKYPSYGDDLDTERETVFTLCDVLKKYLRDLPKPLLSGALWQIFLNGCLYARNSADEADVYKRMAAVQIIFRLLPRKNMSLLIYLIAFLYQLSLRPPNRLTTESIGVIFGPFLLGHSKSGTSTPNPQNMSYSNKGSSEGLRWLLDNWEDSLSQDLLDEEYDCFASPLLSQEPWTAHQTQMNALPAAAFANGQPYADLETRPADDEARQGPTMAQADSIALAPAYATTSQPEEVQAPLLAGTQQPDGPAREFNGDGPSSQAGKVSSPLSASMPASSSAMAQTHSGQRSVSGFAKGEQFSDDIASDPNAAQLFGSLSQLFSDERRKVNAYQHQVQALEARHSEQEQIIAGLRNALSQSQAETQSLRATRAEQEDRLRALQDQGSQASESIQAHENTIRDLRNRFDETTSAHQADIAARDQTLREHEDTILGHEQELKRQREQVQRHQEEIQEQQKAMQSSQASFEEERGQMQAEIAKLREAVQLSDRERDGAKTHLQKIRAMLTEIE